jgi:hypothetical protein
VRAITEYKIKFISIIMKKFINFHNLSNRRHSSNLSKLIYFNDFLCLFLNQNSPSSSSCSLLVSPFFFQYLILNYLAKMHMSAARLGAVGWWCGGQITFYYYYYFYFYTLFSFFNFLFFFSTSIVLLIFRFFSIV